MLKHQPDDENEELVKTVDSILADLSKTEQDVMNLFFTVAALCVLIAVFGIYSVSQRETQRRRKEIAIRKTAGAKTREIMVMFIREYLMITLAACSVRRGVPVGRIIYAPLAARLRLSHLHLMVDVRGGEFGCGSYCIVHHF